MKLTVVSVTGVNEAGHLEAIERTLEVLPVRAKALLHFIPGLTLEGYSEFMMKHLHSIIDTEFALVVQADGYAVHGRFWTDEFFEYQYVGSPWTWEPYVGNGGFSLRSRSFMQACAQFPAPNIAEDVWACCVIRNQLENAGIKFAPVELAAQFGFEHKCFLVPGHSKETSFGFHGRHNLQ